MARLNSVTNLEQRQGERRSDRLASLRALWDVTTLQRVRGCSRWRINAGDGVPVVASPEEAHFANLQRCASVWACPCCSAKIRNERSAEVEQMANLHTAAGGRVFMVTLTVRHTRGQALGHLVNAVAGAWTSILAGRQAKAWKERHGVLGTVRAMEITHGENGWHPHLHVLFVTESWCDAEALGDELRGKWCDFVAAQGLARPLEHVALRVSQGDVSAYVAKVQDADSAHGIALEMTRHDMKEGRRAGRTPFQILRDFRETGDVRDLRLWRVYERATFRRQAITWSAGLRGRFPELGEAATDAEIAERREGGEMLAVIPASTWVDLVKLRGAALGLVLDGARVAGVSGVRIALVGLGLPSDLEMPIPQEVA